MKLINGLIFRRIALFCFVLSLSLSLYSRTGGNMSSAENKKSRYKIAACDWMILKRQKIGSFQLVRELNGDGVEVDMGGLGNRDSFDNKL